MVTICFYFVVFFGLVLYADGARILLVSVQGKSHMISTNAIGQELKNNGHEVYTVAESHYKGKSGNLGAVGLEMLYFHVPLDSKHIDSDHVQKKLVDNIINGSKDFTLLGSVIHESCRNMYADQRFLDEVAALKFDLALVESMPLLPCGMLLPHIYKIPHISVLPGLFTAMIPGSATLPSFCSGALIAFQSKHMSFIERIQSTLFNSIASRAILPTFGKVTGFVPVLTNFTLIDKFRKRGLISDEITEWYSFFDETQLFIIKHTGLTLGYPAPFYPNVIPVEGLSVKDAKPLSPEVNKLVESSKHGVVVVSFGSNVQYLPDDFIIKLVKIFGKRKELFLMRYSGVLNEQNFDMPKNVKFMSWLPQNDLIGHNKTKLFITHGGANGLHEAIYQGVPMLCVPMYGDQHSNAEKLQGKGFGLNFEIMDFTEQELLFKMEEVISNPSYRSKTMEAGLRMRHKPMNARQTAAFWIEHVLKFGGEHLKPSSAELYWWQYFCLDILGFLFGLLLSFLVVITYIFKIVVKAVTGGSHQKKD